MPINLKFQITYTEAEIVKYHKYFIEIKQVLINISLGWSEKNTTSGTVSLEEGRLGGWVGRLFGQKLEIIAR